MNRREFLKSAAALGAASTMLGHEIPDAFAGGRRHIPGGSMLDLSASDAPIDHIVVLMMENRSFDHHLGWLSADATYLENGRSRYGRRFHVNAMNDRMYPKPSGGRVSTYHLTERVAETNPYRGCNHPDPGHGWNAGRAQRDGGFLATGSGNDEYALGFYEAEDLPFYAAITRRFTLLDRYHASLLGPTFPNREYLHSAQSGGVKDNSLPPEVGFPTGFTWPTIWDRLIAAGVPARYYFADLPVTALWGSRLTAITSPITRYFQDCAAGTLPNVVIVDPSFIGQNRTDEHPHGDVRDSQRVVFNYVKAFLDSPHWMNGVFILTYDEWGGFFDHVRPPHLPDDRASRVDDHDFRQAGFRVPTRILSPFARPGFVDHTRYDHTSILRFIEWRFLGAPAHGPGRHSDTWFLTRRDRFANNIGLSLMPSNPDPEFAPDPVSGPTPTYSPACAGDSGGLLRTPTPSDFDRALDTGWVERAGFRYETPPWS